MSTVGRHVAASRHTGVRGAIRRHRSGGRSDRRPLTVAARVVGTIAVAVVLAVATGWAPLRVGLALVFIVPAVSVVYLVARRIGPRWCLAAFVITTALGSSKLAVSAGRINLRVTDIFYVMVLGWAIARFAGDGTRRVDIGQRALAVLLGVFALSLVPVLVTQPHSFFDPFVSWARFVQTVSLVWLIPLVVDRNKDFRIVMQILAAGCAIELVRAVVVALAQDGLNARLQGGNGPDTEGLLAAVLLATILYGGVPARRWPRRAMLVLALVALAASRSVASIAAVGIVIGFVPFTRGTGRRPLGLIRPLWMLVSVAVIVVSVVTLRPQNLPGGAQFQTGSTAQRVVLGADGVLIFASHPVLGVGFSRSSLPNVIADPSNEATLRNWFAGSMGQFVPYAAECEEQKELTAAGPSRNCDLGSVHNAYIQIAAESGLVGLAALLGAAIVVIRRIRRLRISLCPEPVRTTLRWAVIVLVIVLIWWNDNPLFGAQPETLTAAFALGVLAVPWASPAPLDPAPRVESADQFPLMSASRQ